MNAEYGDITRTRPDAFRVKTSGLVEATDAVIGFSLCNIHETLDSNYVLEVDDLSLFPSHIL
jgi:hypothetical protein